MGEPLSAAAALRFTADSRALLLAPSDGEGLLMAEVADGRRALLQRPPPSEGAPQVGSAARGRVSLAAVSPDGQWAATSCVALGGGAVGGSVDVYSLEARRHHATLALPLDSAGGVPRITALAFSPVRPRPLCKTIRESSQQASS
eukprot:5247387-Pyramimonas_sp.AAC.1